MKQISSRNLDIIKILLFYLPKAFAMATFPNTAMTGTKNTELPRSPNISGNVLVLLFSTVLKGGTLNSGNPDFTVPVSLNGDPEPWVSYK